jgi:hypothetical protein
MSEAFRQFMTKRREAKETAASQPSTFAAVEPLPPPPPKKEKVAKAPKPLKAVRQEEPLDSIITYTCGHKIQVRHLRDGACQACIGAARKKKRRERAERVIAAQQQGQRGRLPDGSTFEVCYDASKTAWHGILTVPGVGVFDGEASGVRKLLDTLDDMYRHAVAEKQEPALADSVKE